MARATGLEPATTGSTVRYSNQIELHPLAGAHPPRSTVDRAKDSIPQKRTVKTFPFFSKVMNNAGRAAIFPAMGPLQKWIVFCADDLGISDGTNEGILQAFEAGLVRETSLCVTGKAWKEGIALVKELHPELGMGLHLSFTLGKAVTGPIPELTDPEGNFHPLPTVLKACLFKKLDPNALEAEVLAQLGRARSGDSLLTHINGHHHVHVFPQIRDAVIQALRERPIPWIRLPREKAHLGNLFSLRRNLLAYFSWQFQKKAHKEARSLRLPPRGTAFLGLSGFDRSDYQSFFLKQLQKLQANKAEWMVHPRTQDEDFQGLDHLSTGQGMNFAKELQALTDPDFVSKVLQDGVRPSRFGEIG